MTRGELALVAGAACGVAMVIAGVGRGAAPERVPNGAVATVDGRAISGEDYQRALAAVADPRRPADAALRRRVIDRLIDEKLLVERGIELDLPRTDGRLSAQLSSAVIDMVVARGRQTKAPGRAVLQRFYADNADYFRAPARLHVRQYFFGDGAVAPPAPPDGLLPPSKLRDYLGPAALAAVRALAPGQATAPLPRDGGTVVLALVAREAGRLPPLGQIEAQVRAEWSRRAGDRALRSFLDRQRARARVVVREDRL